VTHSAKSGEIFAIPDDIRKPCAHPPPRRGAAAVAQCRRRLGSTRSCDHLPAAALAALLDRLVRPHRAHRLHAAQRRVQLGQVVRRRFVPRGDRLLQSAARQRAPWREESVRAPRVR
jgi:hypothetical protein